MLRCFILGKKLGRPKIWDTLQNWSEINEINRKLNISHCLCFHDISFKFKIINNDKQNYFNLSTYHFQVLNNNINKHALSREEFVLLTHGILL